MRFGRGERRGEMTRSPRARRTKPPQPMVPRAMGALLLVFAERSPPPPGSCSLSRGPSFRLFSVCTKKDLRHPPAVETFTHSFRFFSGLVGYLVYTSYRLHACSVPSFGGIVFRFILVFLFAGAFLRLVCWWEPTTLCLKGRSDRE